MERVELDIWNCKKRPRESFATFTSRWKDLEHRMRELNMFIEPELLLSKLETAITSSSDVVTKNALQQVRMGIGLARATTGELLASLGGPMRDLEKDARESSETATRANQEKVNAAWQSGGRGGAKGGSKGWGRGGKGGKGKPKGVCLDFAQDKCTRKDCVFEHKKLDGAAITALKAKMADRRSARKASPGAGAGATAGTREARLLQIVHTLKQLPTAKSATGVSSSMADKMALLRARGVGDDSILEMAALFIDN
jgi:hypothetical protein